MPVSTNRGFRSAKFDPSMCSIGHGLKLSGGAAPLGIHKQSARQLGKGRSLERLKRASGVDRRASPRLGNEVSPSAEPVVAIHSQGFRKGTGALDDRSFPPLARAVTGASVRRRAWSLDTNKPTTEKRADSSFQLCKV